MTYVTKIIYSLDAHAWHRMRKVFKKIMCIKTFFETPSSGTLQLRSGVMLGKLLHGNYDPAK
jgi:hypothetical protein